MIAADRLKSIIGRIERLNSEKDDLTADIKEVFGEAKGAGFDIPAIRTIIKLRKTDTSDRIEAECTLKIYMDAMGMQTDLFRNQHQQEPATTGTSINPISEETTVGYPPGQ